MYFFGFSNNRIVSIFMLLAILMLSLAMSAYLPILEGLDERPIPTTYGTVPTGAQSDNAVPTGAQNDNAVPMGEVDLNKIYSRTAPKFNPL
jgi:hypothetical protein